MIGGFYRGEDTASRTDSAKIRRSIASDHNRDPLSFDDEEPEDDEIERLLAANDASIPQHQHDAMQEAEGVSADFFDDQQPPPPIVRSQLPQPQLPQDSRPW